MARRDWHLTMPGVTERVKEVAKDHGVDVFDVTASHSNLPAQLTVSTDIGVMKISITVTELSDVEQVIQDAFKGSKKSLDVIEETRPENLPDPEPESNRVTPTVTVVEEVPSNQNTNLPQNPKMKSDTGKGKG